MNHLVARARSGLAALADPVTAGQMQAYMKSTMPFRGVPKPARAQLLRALLAAHPIADAGELREVAAELWSGAEFREERYLALSIIDQRRCAAWSGPPWLPTFRDWIIEGAWWDFTDEIASRRIGSGDSSPRTPACRRCPGRRRSSTCDAGGRAPGNARAVTAGRRSRRPTRWGSTCSASASTRWRPGNAAKTASGVWRGRYGRRVRRGWLGLVMASLAIGATACTTSVAGAGVPAPAVPTFTPAPSAAPPSAPGGPRSGLDTDVVADECLLNASEFGALVGQAVSPPEQSRVARPDGSTGSSCIAMASGTPIAMINVYRVRTGTPADYVRAGAPGGRHEVSGVGAAAVVIDTQTGPTLQLAGPAHVITILVSNGAPTDDAWRTAATAALSRLPS